MDSVIDKPQVISQKNPPGFPIYLPDLLQFETDLDPMDPERCTLPCRVLGYGEISTVIEILTDELRGWALKRLSIFESSQEILDYLEIYQEYNRLLEEEIGVNLPPHGHIAIDDRSERPILYLIQEKVPADSIGSTAVHLLEPDLEMNLAFFRLVLEETWKIWAFNDLNPKLRVGLDAQVSNWCLCDFDPDQALTDESELAYLDTSTPFFRVNKVEQLDPELFLRPAPSFLTWILRLLFLEDVVDRYYCFRKVVIDIIANYYKEQRADLVPHLVEAANEYFDAINVSIDPVEVAEIRRYYREDAVIWRLYAWMRRVDRSLYHLAGRDYPYILPGKVKR